jgi:hypothetical protein
MASLDYVVRLSKKQKKRRKEGRKEGKKEGRKEEKKEKRKGKERHKGLYYIRDSYMSDFHNEKLSCYKSINSFSYSKKEDSAGHGGTHLQSQLLRRYRQEDHEFKANLGKIRGSLSPKQTKTEGLEVWLK